MGWRNRKLNLGHGTASHYATRFIALTVCALLIAVSLSAGAFLLTHAHHVHDHDGPHGNCTTCAHIWAANQLLKQVAAAADDATSANVVLVALQTILPAAFIDTVLITLVNLKVRLNN